MLGIGYFFTITGTNQTGYTSIDTNLFRCWWQYFNSVVIYQQGDEPTSRWFEFDCNSRRTTAFGQKSRPNAARTRRASLDATCLRSRLLQRFFAFCKPKSIVSVLKCRFGKLSRTAIAFGFKPWIVGSFTPKVCESFLQMSQALLQWYTANFIEKVQFFGLFPVCKKARGFLILDSLLSLVPSFGSSSQSFVQPAKQASVARRDLSLRLCDQTHTTHCPSQEIFLRLCRVKTVAVCFFSHTSHYTIYNVKNLIEGGVSSHR